MQAAVPSGRRLLATATSAQVYVELDASSHDDLSGITSDLTNVISSGKLSVSMCCPMVKGCVGSQSLAPQCVWLLPACMVQGKSFLHGRAHCTCHLIIIALHCKAAIGMPERQHIPPRVSCDEVCSPGQGD